MANTNKFTPTRKKALLKLLKDAIPISAACDKIGIDRTTYYNWKKKAEAYNKNDPDTKDLEKYHTFFEKIYKAKAEALETLIKDIYQCGKGYEATKIVESYDIVVTQNEDGKSEESIQNRTITKTTQFIRHPGSLLFLAERLFPALLGNRLKLDGEGIDQLILREIIRLAGSYESGNLEGTQTKRIKEPGKELAEPQPINKPQDWETLPTQQPEDN